MSTQTSSARTVIDSPAGQGRDLVLTKSLDAPRALVFRMWTEPEHFARWFGPHGSTMPHCRMDARPGGDLHFCHDHRGEIVWVRGTYREVESPEVIEFSCHFSDKDGNRRDRPGFPLDMVIRVELAEVDGRTKLTIRHSGLERDQGEVQGWMESLERLSDLIGRV